MLSFFQYKETSKVIDDLFDQKKLVVHLEVNKHNSRVIACHPSRVSPLLPSKTLASTIVFRFVSKGLIRDPYFFKVSKYFKVH